VLFSKNSGVKPTVKFVKRNIQLLEEDIQESTQLFTLAELFIDISVNAPPAITWVISTIKIQCNLATIVQKLLVFVALYICHHAAQAELLLMSIHWKSLM